MRHTRPQMVNAYISGTGSYVPPRVVTNDDLRTQFGIDTTHEWVVQRTGINERRFAEEGVGPVELALEASKQALASANLQPKDIDMILFATLSPQHVFPGSGVFLQRALGMLDGDDPKYVPAMDIRNQCSGFLYSLQTAAAMVQSGIHKHVLVVGAEKHSAALDLTTRGRTVSALFGDGAGAVVVSATEEDRGIRGSWLGADGRFAEELWMPIWDTRRKTFVELDEKGNGVIPPEYLWPQMNGKVVFKHAVEKMIASIFEASFKLGFSMEDIGLWAFHQANKRINDYIAEQLSLPQERVLSNIERYGNTTAATIPLLLDEAVKSGQLKRGTKVACVGFGAGFTWGAAVIDW